MCYFFAKHFRYIAALPALLVVAHTSAQPRVRVQAQSEISTRWLSGAVLEVELNDDRGQPLTRRALTVSGPDQRAPLTRLMTDGGGRVRWAVKPRLAAGTKVEVHFPGDRYYLPSTVLAELDLSIQQRLRWVEPWSAIDLNAGEQRWIMQLESDSSGVAIADRQLSLSLQGQVIAQAASDREGAFRITIPSAQLPVGGFVVEATVLERGTAPTVTLVHTLRGVLTTTIAASAERRSDGVVVVRGKLSSVRGTLASREIKVRQGSQVLAQGTTDMDGAFVTILERETWPDSQSALPVLAHFESNESGLLDSRSAPIIIHLMPAAARSRVWPWVLSFLCAVALGIAKWRQRARQAVLQADEESRSGRPLEPVETVLESRLNPNVHALFITVRDELDGQPLTNATVELQNTEANSTPFALGRTDEHGCLISSALKAGSHRITIRAEGYLPEQRVVDVQTHPAPTYLNAALIGTRTIVWQAFKPLASQVPTGGTHGGIATPAELSQWGQRLCNITLQNLGTEAERSLFGRGAPSPENASRLQRALQQVAVIATDPEHEQT